MKLSVVIVNYNVKYFLELALQSVRRATKNISTEIFVVDNNSSDGSVEFIRQKFPEVKLIVNKENLGFAKANNQAIKQAAGDYILLLNPDTVVREDSFEKCLRFLDEHPDAGALGVKMLDGKGNFLPESKRALPSPSVAFWKMFGLSSLFPKSKTFARYHLGYLNENKNHTVDVLAGAFMMMRKSTLDKTGLLDEDYFMYGEDIDLCYRISKAGFKNYYFAETDIIHYKGESTKKGSLNYVRMFYNAMIIFARKHSSFSSAGFFSLFISLAIYLKAGFDLVKKFFGALFLPLLDSAFIIGGMYFIKDFYAKNIKGAHEYYPKEFMLYIVPTYALVWVVTTFFGGGYDKPYRIGKVLRGIVVGTIIISAIYGFFEESYRFSRALILLGAIWAAIEMILLRIGFNVFRDRRYLLRQKEDNRVIICGTQDEANRTLALLNQAGADVNYIGYVSINEAPTSATHLGKLDQLKEITGLYSVNEIIFCLQDILPSQIIDWMKKLGSHLDYKIVPEQSQSIIGSNSKNTAGDLYAVDINLEILRTNNKRNKRVFDLLFCGFTLLTIPIQLFLVKNPIGFLGNWITVLIGTKSWVGFAKSTSTISIPKIKNAVLSPLDGVKVKAIDDLSVSRLNLLYAKEYSAYEDLRIVMKGYRNLGRN